ncbi:hypothetical protein FQN54_004874 [Arachnomyces sp. PD_36]|nr:hypothetical protein FQN54_004874 [Arachnomyces sp. PD_36]
MGSTAEDLHIERYGLSQIYTSKDPLVDIVLVHGLNGDPHKSWTAKKSKCFWPVDLLPNDLGDQRVRILTYGYDADVATFTDGASKSKLHVHAENLVARLAANRNRKKALDRPIIFVCHSLGGLIVKRALIYSRSLEHQHLEHTRSVFISTYGILFLGTPHNGSDIAKWATMLQSICSVALPKAFFDSSPQLVEALKTNNETLQNINRLFSDFLGKFHIYFFHEGKPMDLKGTRRFIVDEESAAPTIDGVERMGIEADHSSMCKFESENSPGYESVFDAIQRYADDAPSTIKRRWAEELENRKIRRANEIAALSQSQMGGETGTQGPSYNGNTASENNEPLLIAPPGFHPNYTFCGMATELVELHKRLRNEKKRAGGSAAVLIYGGPGAGKSHLAREYVFQHRSSYTGGIFWVDAKSKESRSKCFWDIAQAASLLGGATPDPGWHAAESYVGTVRKWFESRQEWLLVFDGISFDHDDDINEFKPLLPYSRNSSIIYTSVDKTLGRKQRLYEPFPLKVKPLEIPDACKLLFKDLGIKKPTPKQVRKAEELVVYYECLPLAIHAIGHRLRAADKSIEKYHVDSHPTDIKLAEPYSGIMTDLRQYAHIEALNLITILSFFGHNVPVAMIQLGRKALVDFNVEVKSTDRQGFSPRDLDTTFGILIKYGLIERSMDPYPSSDKASSFRSDSLVVVDEAPGLSDSHTDSSHASSGRYNQIDVIKIHSVVQGFCRDDLKAKDPRLLYQWLTYAIKVFCLSYDNAHGRIKSAKTKGLVRDYREYETHAVRLMGHFPDPKKDPTDLRRVYAELNETLVSIREEIEDNSPTNSQESFRKQKSVFDRSSSSSSAPDTPLSGPSKTSTWDIENQTHSPVDLVQPATIHELQKPALVLSHNGFSVEDIGYASGVEDCTTIQPSPSMSQTTPKPASESGQTDDGGWEEAAPAKRKKKSRLSFVSSLVGKMRGKDLGEHRPVASPTDTSSKGSWKLSNYGIRKQTPPKTETGRPSANQLSPATSHDGEVRKVKTSSSDRVQRPTYANVAAQPRHSGSLRQRNRSPSRSSQRPQSVAIYSNSSKESLRSRSSNAQSSRMSRSFRSEPGVPVPAIPHLDPHSAPGSRLHSRKPSSTRLDQGAAAARQPRYSPPEVPAYNVAPIPYEANISISRPPSRPPSRLSRTGAENYGLGLGLVQSAPGGPPQPQPAGYSSQPMSRDPSGQSDHSFRSDPNQYSSRISPMPSLHNMDPNAPPYYPINQTNPAGTAQMGAWAKPLHLSDYVPGEAPAMSRDSSAGGPGLLVDLGSGQGHGIVGFGQVPNPQEVQFGNFKPISVDEARQRTLEYERRLAFEQGQFRRQRGGPNPVPYPARNMIPTDSDRGQLETLLSHSEVMTRDERPVNEGARTTGRPRGGSYPLRPASNGSVW